MTTALNIPIDAAAARLRAASYTVERQGMHWRVAPPGGELAITSADEVRALAIGLGETTTTTALDYAALDAETRIVVQQRTTEIKALMKRAASDIIEIGQKLIEVKAKLPHGAWLPWLRSEFAWSDDTARNHMNVARAFREIPNGSEFDARALYLLAAPSTPQAARVEAIERASAGETITLPAARQMVTEHKPPALPPVVPALPTPPAVAADIADAARALGLTAEARGDGVLLYWPDEVDDLGQMDPLWPDVAREWLTNEAPGLAARRAELLSTPPATPPGLSPEAIAHRAIVAAQNDLEAKGWTVRRVAGGDYRLKIGADEYETSGAGVVTASLLLGARSFASPDDLMAAVNAIGDEAPAVETKPPTTTTAHTCECGQPGIEHANIGGISAWWCAGCKSREEQADLRENLGDQYLGYEDVPHLGGSFHKIAWTGDGGGYYAYDDALSMLHSSAMQLRKQAAAHTPTLLDPRAAAVAWRSRMQTMLEACSEHAMFRLSEMQTAVVHIDALLTLLAEQEMPARSADKNEYGPVPTLAEVAGDPLAEIERRVGDIEALLGAGTVPYQANELRACRRALEDLVSDERVSTEAYDELSARIGEAQAHVAEMLSE